MSSHYQQQGETHTPNRAYMHTTQAGSISPLLQSLITGALLGLTALLVVGRNTLGKRIV